MPHATISLAFALHSGFKLALAKSHSFSSTSAADAATTPEDATRCLFKAGPIFRSSPSGDTFDEFEAGSFAEASMELQLKLHSEGKCISSSGCSVWHGSLDDNAGHYYGWYSPAWGNLLSEYWEARGAAALAGVKYEGSPIPGNTWLSKLPSKHNAYPALKDLSALNKMCNDCTGGMFPHLCEGKWTRIRQMIRDDTQAALKIFSEEATEPLPAFDENDVLVHIRFEKSHPQVAWYAKSFLMGIYQTTRLGLSCSQQSHSGESQSWIHTLRCSKNCVRTGSGSALLRGSQEPNFTTSRRLRWLRPCFATAALTACGLLWPTVERQSCPLIILPMGRCLQLMIGPGLQGTHCQIQNGNACPKRIGFLTLQSGSWRTESVTAVVAAPTVAGSAAVDVAAC